MICYISSTQLYQLSLSLLAAELVEDIVNVLAVRARKTFNVVIIDNVASSVAGTLTALVSEVFAVMLCVTLSKLHESALHQSQNFSKLLLFREFLFAVELFELL